MSFNAMKMMRCEQQYSLQANKKNKKIKKKLTTPTNQLILSSNYKERNILLIATKRNTRG